MHALYSCRKQEWRPVRNVRTVNRDTQLRVALLKGSIAFCLSLVQTDGIFYPGWASLAKIHKLLFSHRKLGQISAQEMTTSYSFDRISSLAFHMLIYKAFSEV